MCLNNSGACMVLGERRCLGKRRRSILRRRRLGDIEREMAREQDREIEVNNRRRAMMPGPPSPPGPSGDKPLNCAHEDASKAHVHGRLSTGMATSYPCYLIIACCFSPVLSTVAKGSCFMMPVQRAPNRKKYTVLKK